MKTWTIIIAVAVALGGNMNCSVEGKTISPRGEDGGKEEAKYTESPTSPATKDTPTPDFQPAITTPENLIKNGDFEGDFSSKGIAEGWNDYHSWGKATVAYSRESGNARSGASCQKIHVSSFEKGAVQFSQPNFPVEAGRTYTISVWMRGEGEMKRVTINAQKAHWNFYISGDWQEYRFEATPAEDDQKAVFLFNLKSTGTLYIDDISVVASETKRAPLVYEPLPLRLERGNELSLVVDAKNILRPTTLLAGGVSMLSLGRWLGYPYDAKDGSYTMTSKMEDEFRQLNLPLTRFYAIVEEEPFDDPRVAIDKIAFFLERVGIPQDTVMIALEPWHAKSKFTPEQYAEVVRHSQSKGYSFQYWEIGNEVYVPAVYLGGGGIFKQPEDYVRHIKAVGEAIRAVQPRAKIGISVHGDIPTWGTEVLAAAAGSYDFVCPHLYSFGEIDNERIEETILGDNTRSLTRALKLQAFIDSVNPGKNVYIYDSEWGLHYMPEKGAGKEYRNGNIVGTLFRAVRMLYYAREAVVHGASGWKAFTDYDDPGFGVMFHKIPERRSMLFWLHYYFNNFTGSQVLEIEGTSPYYTPVKHTTGDPRIPAVPLTPAMVTASEDGKKLFIMAVNASWNESVPASLKLENFQIQSAVGICLSHRDLEAHPLLEKNEDFVSSLPLSKTSANDLKWIMPPGAIAFITIE